MMQSVRAVYKDGLLRLLDPVDLVDGQEVSITIMSERDRVRAALGDLLAQLPDPTRDDIDENELMREIEAGFRGQPPLSETIIAERHEHRVT